MVVVIEAELVVDAGRVILAAQRTRLIVVALIVCTHLDQEVPNVVELAVYLLLETRCQLVDIPPQWVQIDDILLGEELYSLEEIVGLYDGEALHASPLSLVHFLPVPDIVAVEKVLELCVLELNLDVLD